MDLSIQNLLFLFKKTVGLFMKRMTILLGLKMFLKESIIYQAAISGCLKSLKMEKN